MDHIVGMGEYILSDRQDDTIRTFALASCVAVTAYSPGRKAAGMIHVVLPFPFDNKAASERPAYFAKTGVPLMINSICRRYGCRKEELMIQMYGGAGSGNSNDIYKVGLKNVESVKNVLQDMGLRISKEELYGNESRTLAMDVRSGAIKIFSQPIMIAGR